MTPVLFNQAGILSMLADVIGTTLNGAKMGLYQNNLVFDPTVTVLADLAEADFTGYARTTLTWDTPSVSDDGGPETHSNRITWRPTDGVTPNDIYGFFVVNAGGDLIAGGYFDGSPLPMNGTLDVILTTVVVRLVSDGFVVTIS